MVDVRVRDGMNGDPMWMPLEDVKAFMDGIPTYHKAYKADTGVDSAWALGEEAAAFADAAATEGQSEQFKVRWRALSEHAEAGWAAAREYGRRYDVRTRKVLALQTELAEVRRDAEAAVVRMAGLEKQVAGLEKQLADARQMVVKLSGTNTQAEIDRLNQQLAEASSRATVITNGKNAIIAKLMAEKDADAVNYVNVIEGLKRQLRDAGQQLQETIGIKNGAIDRLIAERDAAWGRAPVKASEAEEQLRAQLRMANDECTAWRRQHVVNRATIDRQVQAIRDALAVLSELSGEPDVKLAMNALKGSGVV